MKTLTITLKRLVKKGSTCPRCGATGRELATAVSALKKSLSPLGIKVALEKEELSLPSFRKRPLQSNQIWLNGRLLEAWLGGTSSQTPCSDVCGRTGCRTVEVAGATYETIPAAFVIKAGLLAAADLIGLERDDSCCES
jgi:hypothetical protein